MVGGGALSSCRQRAAQTDEEGRGKRGVNLEFERYGTSGEKTGTTGESTECSTGKGRRNDPRARERGGI